MVKARPSPSVSSQPDPVSEAENESEDRSSTFSLISSPSILVLRMATSLRRISWSSAVSVASTVSASSSMSSAARSFSAAASIVLASTVLSPVVVAAEPSKLNVCGGADCASTLTPDAPVASTVAPTIRADVSFDTLLKASAIPTPTAVADLPDTAALTDAAPTKELMMLSSLAITSAAPTVISVLVPLISATAPAAMRLRAAAPPPAMDRAFLLEPDSATEAAAAVALIACLDRAVTESSAAGVSEVSVPVRTLSTTA